MARGDKLKGAMRKDPGNLERVSPGVYRNRGGQLVSRQGRSMGRRGGDGRDAGANQQMSDLMYRYPPGQTPNWEQIGETFGIVPGQIQNGLGETGGANPVQWTDAPMRDQPGPSPEMVARFRDAANKFGAGMGQGANPQANPVFEQQFQPSANRGGKYRLSPGVYGSREQAMRQFEQQQQMAQNMQQFVPYLKNR